MRSLLLILALATVSFAGTNVVITEIMYNPSSGEQDEKQTEWVEIFNAGTSPANLHDYQLTSGIKGDPKSAKQKYIISDLTLAPGQYAVIGIGGKEAYAGLGLPDFDAYAAETKYAWLLNAGDGVALRDEKSQVVDEVIFGVESPWPKKRTGASIQFMGALDADAGKSNDDAKNWVQSDAKNADEFKGHGKGTPGHQLVRPTTQPGRK